MKHSLNKSKFRKVTKTNTSKKKRKTNNKSNKNKIKSKTLKKSKKYKKSKKKKARGVSDNISINIIILDENQKSVKITINKNNNIKNELTEKLDKELGMKKYIRQVYFGEDVIDMDSTFKNEINDLEEDGRLTVLIENYEIFIYIRDPDNDIPEDELPRINIDVTKSIRQQLRRHYLKKDEDLFSINGIHNKGIMYGTFIDNIETIRNGSTLVVKTEKNICCDLDYPHHYKCDLFNGGEQCTCIEEYEKDVQNSKNLEETEKANRRLEDFLRDYEDKVPTGLY